jgi:hypothetical protein
MDEETLTILLRGEHVNMPYRIEHGLWPHPPLRFAEISAHLVKLLEKERWFPREWKPHREGEPIREGGVIERKEHRYVYRAVRSHPIEARLLAERVERVFPNAEEAARYYLKWDLHLPGDLDGWKVIE